MFGGEERDDVVDFLGCVILFGWDCVFEPFVEGFVWFVEGGCVVLVECVHVIGVDVVWGDYVDCDVFACYFVCECFDDVEQCGLERV